MEENSGISLGELFQALKKRWYIILITVLLGVIATGILAFAVIVPKYKSTAEVMLNWKYEDGTVDLNNTNRISETIAAYFKTDLVLEDVVSELKENKNIDMSVASVRNGTDIKYSTTVFFLSINFTHIDPDTAKVVARQIVDSGYNIANDPATPPSEELIVKEAFQLVTPPKKGVYASPNKTLYLIVGFLIGAVVGAALIFILEFAANTYKYKDEIENDLELQVIGVIPEYTVTDSDIEKMKGHDKNVK